MFFRHRKVYLDNNATTPLAKSVRKKMNKVLKKSYGNPSSSHSIGREAAGLIAESRERVANTINAKPNEIFFNSGATEGNNHLLSQLTEIFFPKKIVLSPLL